VNEDKHNSFEEQEFETPSRNMKNKHGRKAKHKSSNDKHKMLPTNHEDKKACNAAFISAEAADLQQSQNEMGVKLNQDKPTMLEFYRIENIWTARRNLKNLSTRKQVLVEQSKKQTNKQTNK